MVGALLDAADGGVQRVRASQRVVVYRDQKACGGCRAMRRRGGTSAAPRSPYAWLRDTGSDSGGRSCWIGRRSRIALFLAMLLPPAIARAHLTDTGLGPIYDGIAHLLLSFDDLLPVVALALLAGLNGAQAGRLVLFVLPFAWLAGGIAGVWAGGAAAPPIVTSLSLLALGVLTAASARLRPSLVVVLAVALGWIHGSLNGAAIAAAGRESSGLIWIAGTVFIVIAFVSALVVSLHKPWTRIAVRVTGSWIADVGLLMLGWGVRGVLS